MNDPVAAWRALQAEVPDSAAWVESVMPAQQDAGFVYHGKAMLEVAEPTFVTASQVAADQRAAEAVVAALVAAGRLLLDDRDLQNTYIPGWLDGVPDADLFSLPSGYSQPIVFGRLDGVRTSEGLHFLEFNGACRAESCPPTAARTCWPTRTWPGGSASSTRSAPQPSARTCWMR